MFQEENPSDEWLRTFKGIESLTEQLRYVLMILYSLKDDKQELFIEDIKYVENILADNKFVRRVKYRDAMVEQNPSEYFGKDFGHDDPFRYLEKTEHQISEISLELLGILGRVIKAVKNTGFVIGDEA